MTTNSRTIKLWKMGPQVIKKVIKSSGKELTMPKLQITEDGLVPTLKYIF
jgi:hypothetical protein